MKEILKNVTMTTKIRSSWPKNSRFIAAASFICLALGLWLSHLIESGVSVQEVMLGEETPAIKFIPVGPGPHPVALLVHGYASSKETLFRYGEALAAGGFICYSVDQPGHGASQQTFTYLKAVHTLEAVAHEIGPVDVFAGHSLGGFTGGEAVRQGGMKPGLFIAIGAIMPVLGEHAPPVLILAGQFEVLSPSALLKTRTDASLVISPWSDHLLEAFDPVLVNAAVDAACAAANKTPGPPPTAWLWRLVGIAMAMVASGWLAHCLTDLFPRLARCRGLFIGSFIAVAFMLTVGGRWLDATPHFRLQGIAIPIIFILATIARRLGIPRWSFAAIGVLAVAIGVCWMKLSPTVNVWVFVACAVVLTPALIAGVIIGRVAASRGSRLQGDIAMAIFVGFVPFQCMEPPRTAPQSQTPHAAIKLEAKLLNEFVGEYEIARDNVFLNGAKVRIQREGDHLVWQAFGTTAFPGALDLYPESETNFFLEITDAQITFIKNDKGHVTGFIHHQEGLPDSEGKKLNQ